MKPFVKDKHHPAPSDRRVTIIALCAILILAFLVRFFAAVDYHKACDKMFPDTWNISKYTLSQDESLYIQHADPGTERSDAFAPWARHPYYRPPLASYYFQFLFLCQFCLL